MKTILPINMNDFTLPCIVSNDNEYYTELKKYLDRYIKYVSKIQNLQKECLNRTKKNIEHLLSCLSLYNNARVGEAKECIKDILKYYIDEPYVVAELNKNYAFRGIAPKGIQSIKFNYSNAYGDVYNKMNECPLSFYKARVEVKTICRRDMLHIPFDKRGLIKTQRFSIAGVPCLYVATTSFGCWLEMEMPEPDIFQVSSYQLPSNLKILNMCISQDMINGSTGGIYVEDYELQHIYSLIEIFPLVCATSFKVLEMNRNFKSEYIISQLLMQVANEFDISGIAYLSKKMKDKYAYPQAVNLAILMPCEKLPPYSEELSDMYWKYSDKIKLSNAFRYSEFLKINSKDSVVNHKAPFLSYVNEIYYDDDLNDTMLAGKKIKYTETIFSQFDEFILNQKQYSFK